MRAQSPALIRAGNRERDLATAIDHPRTATRVGWVKPGRSPPRRSGRRSRLPTGSASIATNTEPTYSLIQRLAGELDVSVHATACGHRAARGVASGEPVGAAPITGETKAARRRLAAQQSPGMHHCAKSAAGHPSSSGQRLDGGDRRAARAIAQRDFADDHARQRLAPMIATPRRRQHGRLALPIETENKNRRLALPQQHLAGSARNG